MSSVSRAIDKDVTIIGGGICGLICGITLRRLGYSVIVLERRDEESSETGGDLALWPSAIKILKTIGVRDEFFQKDCFPLHTVHICNMDFESTDTEGRCEILKTIDMAAVTEGSGEQFVLVGRQRIMDAIREIVPTGCVMYEADAREVREDLDGDCVHVTYYSGENIGNVTSRFVIGADGVQSMVREYVCDEDTNEQGSIVTFCNEVCYRGVLNLGDEQVDMERLFVDGANDGTMRINYGAGLRSSFGYMSADGKVGYWWVKQPCSDEREARKRGKISNCTWPQPLKKLHDNTPDGSFYAHPILDGRELSAWSKGRVVLIGDSAHVVTPNMGQGACLATEDAFVLAVLLRESDSYDTAFEKYETCRKSHAAIVAAEARKQLFLGQLANRVAVFLRNFVLSLLPCSVLLRTLRSNLFDVSHYVDTFNTCSVHDKP